MRQLILLATLAISLVFPEVRAAPVAADIGQTTVCFRFQGLNQKTGQSAEEAMGPGFILSLPAAEIRMPHRAQFDYAPFPSALLGVVTGYYPTHPQEVMTMATAATETDTKAVSKATSGMARVVPADRVGDLLTSLDFGPVVLGQSATRTLTVYNIGTADLSVNIPSLDSPFSMVSPTGSFTVAPGGQRSVTVRFSPTTAGSHSGVLSIASNDPDAATVAVQLQGIGEGVPNISVDPTMLDLGSVSVGQSATEDLTVYNTGTADLTVNIFSPNPPFSVVSPAVPFTVAPSGQQPVTVAFSPTTAGSHSGVLSIASNDPDAATVAVPLQGVGVVPDITVSTTWFHFGTIRTTHSEWRDLNVLNTGSTTLTVTNITIQDEAISNGFAVYGYPRLPFPVAPGGEQSLTVRFLPYYRGPYNSLIRITSNDPDEQTVSIRLMGEAVEF